MITHWMKMVMNNYVNLPFELLNPDYRLPITNHIILKKKWNPPNENTTFMA